MIFRIKPVRRHLCYLANNKNVHMKLLPKMISMTVLLSAAPAVLWAQLTEQRISKEKWQPYGHTKSIGVAKASLEYKVNDIDTTFILLLEDERKELKSFFSVSFSGRGNTLQNLYTILVSFFEKENWRDDSYIKIFTLGETKVSVYKATGLIPQKAIIFSTDKGRCRLTRKEINQLFNK